MKYDVSIDKSLFNTYSEIRLGLLRFHADVKAPDDQFWSYMDTEVLPKVRSSIEEKEWSEILGIRGSRAAYKAFGRNPGRYRVSSETWKKMSVKVLQANISARRPDAAKKEPTR